MVQRQESWMRPHQVGEGGQVGGALWGCPLHTWERVNVAVTLVMLQLQESWMRPHQVTGMG